MKPLNILLLLLVFFHLPVTGQVTVKQPIEPHQPRVGQLEIKCADLAIERFEAKLYDKISNNSGSFNYFVTVKNKGNADYKAAGSSADAVVVINKHNGTDWQYYLYTSHFDSLKAGDTIRLQVRGRWSNNILVTTNGKINSVRARLHTAYNRRDRENCNRNNDEIIIPPTVFREALLKK